MKLIFESSSVWRAFNELTEAARKTSALGLMEAAVSFTAQLALASPLFAATARDQVEIRSLQDELISKLKTWRDDEGAMKLRLMTYDVECVVGNLARTAQRYASPRQISSEATAAVDANIPRDLTVAAVAFTIQIALEETARDAAEMRSLERAMIAALEMPWEPSGTISLSVDVQDGAAWPSPEEE